MDMTHPKSNAWAPLAEPTFRRIWITSLISNLGHLMLGVAAMWEMTRLTPSKEMAALVQTALMVPLVFVSLPAGAVADMFDRRRIAMAGLGFSILSGVGLTTLSATGLLTPWLLLLFCALIGAGVALYNPSWQASIGEQVGPEQLPAAIALGTISYNTARSVGPAIGGIIVAALGAQAVFAINALFYAPLLIAFLLWKRLHVPSRLPPERLDRAIVTGARFALHSPPVRNIMLRTSAFCAAGATSMSLGAVVVKDLLGGGAGSFGLLMGAGGVGAVLAATQIARVRSAIPPETVVRTGAVLSVISLAIIGLSTSLILSCVAMAVASAANMLSIALLNVSVQTAVPRWVTARALSLFGAAITAGIAIGAWFWGWFAGHWGVTSAFLGSSAMVATTILLGFVFPLRDSADSEAEMSPLDDELKVEMAISLRSGPITVEIDYEVDPEQARAFHGVMLKMQRARKRRGAFEWSISRDIANPARWTERFHCPTWADYLRQRSRYTQADRELQEEADSFHIGAFDGRVRRMLDRPFGSVRWKADSLDTGDPGISYIGP
jgi:MFS family permease